MAKPAVPCEVHQHINHLPPTAQAGIHPQIALVHLFQLYTDTTPPRLDQGAARLEATVSWCWMGLSMQSVGRSDGDRVPRSCHWYLLTNSQPGQADLWTGSGELASPPSLPPTAPSSHKSSDTV